MSTPPNFMIKSLAEPTTLFEHANGINRIELA